MDELTQEAWIACRIIDIAERHGVKAEFNFGTKTLFLDGDDQNALNAFYEIEETLGKEDINVC